MDIETAKAWLRGERSWRNGLFDITDPEHRANTIVLVEQADAATIQYAYWRVKAHKEGLTE